MPREKKVGKYELPGGLNCHVGTSAPITRLAIDTETGQRFAATAYSKSQPEAMAQVKHELGALKRLSHPNVVKLVEVLQSKHNIYLIRELTTGGDVFDMIVSKKDQRLDEGTARSLFQQLVAGLLHCHRNGVAHRDVKPENLLRDDHGTLKLAEFGLSVVSPEGMSRDRSECSGTPNYAAPELLHDASYDYFKADVWSCGVVLFAMLSGALPFDSPNIRELFDRINKGSYKMPEVVPSGAADLIDCLLVVDPAKRLSLDEITQHPWFADGFDPARL